MTTTTGTPIETPTMAPAHTRVPTKVLFAICKETGVQPEPYCIECDLTWPCPSAIAQGLGESKFRTTPRGALIFVCGCGHETRVRRDRPGWMCPNCWKQWHGHTPASHDALSRQETP